MHKAVIGGIIALVIMIGGVVWVSRSDTADAPAENATNSPQQTATDEAITQSTSEAPTITFDGNSFSPSELTVPAGTTVTITNTSSREIQFDSDPHPAHTDNPELNVGTVEPGQSETFTVTTTGEHGFHDHLSANITGTLTVE